MVVKTMTGQQSQGDLEKASESYPSLSLQFSSGLEKETRQLPVVVKNLTTVGVILEILHLESGLNTEGLKGGEGVFKIPAQDDQVMIEVPGKILWSRKREDTAGLTVGLELLGPLPLPVRQRLEAQMGIDATDMKVLWDYWDEIQESAGPADLAIPLPAVPATPDSVVDFQEQADTRGSHDWLYWLGFGGILAGLALQFPQSEDLGVSGLVAMFFGSMVIAWKSIMSMRQLPSAAPLKKGESWNQPGERMLAGETERES
jgi:hypothetical protein